MRCDIIKPIEIWILLAISALNIGNIGAQSLSHTYVAVSEPYESDVTPIFSDGLVPIKIRNHWGFMDTEGNIVIDPEYSRVSNFHNGIATVLVMGELFDSIRGPLLYSTNYCIDRTGKRVLEYEVDWWHTTARGMLTFSEGLGRVMLNKKWGFIDYSCKFAIEPKFEYALDFNDGLAVVVMDTGCGYIDKTGNIVISPIYENATSFNNGIAAVRLNEQWLLIDQVGNTLETLDVDFVRAFREGIASVRIGKQWGFINEKGNIIIQPRYDKVRDCHDGLIVVEEDEKFGVIDKNGNVIVEPVFDEIRSFQEGLAAVEIDGKWGFINKNGKTIINAIYRQAFDFRDGLASVFGQQGWLIIDTLGNKNDKIPYYFRPYFHDGIALVSDQGKIKVVDTNYHVLLSPIVEAVGDFKNGLALVKKGHMSTFGEPKPYSLNWFIDTTGRTVLIPTSNRVEDFSDGLSLIGPYGEELFIDKTGEEVLEPWRMRNFVGGYRTVQPFSEGLAAFSNEEGFWGYMDKNGNIVIEPKYSDAWPFSNGLAFVGFPNGMEIEKVDEIDTSGAIVGQREILIPMIMYGCIDKNGNVIIPPIKTWTRGSVFKDSVALVATVLNRSSDYYLPEDAETDDQTYEESKEVYKYYNMKGELLDITDDFDDEYIKFNDFSDGLALVRKNNLYGFIDKKGNAVIDFMFCEASDFHEGLAKVLINDKYGYIGKTGQIVISPQYTDAADFSCGLARVSVHGKYGFINKKGEMVISPRYY